MRPVQLMIAGAPKCGTTSLKHYFGQHPNICTHKQLEMLYFTMDEVYQKGYLQAYSRYFKNENTVNSVILAKSAAIIYSPIAMQRLYDHNPDIQIVIILRNPVDRAYSAYWYARWMGWEDLLTFEAAIEAEPLRINNYNIQLQGSIYLERSLYAKHLSNLHNVFNKNQVHIFLTEDLIRDPVGLCKGFFRLFNLDPSFVPDTKSYHNVATLPRNQSLNWLLFSKHPISLHIRISIRRLLPDRLGDYLKIRLDAANRKQYKPPVMSFETRRKLVEYFKPYNAELSDLLGRDLGAWDV